MQDKKKDQEQSIEKLRKMEREKDELEDQVAKLQRDQVPVTGDRDAALAAKADLEAELEKASKEVERLEERLRGQEARAQQMEEELRATHEEDAAELQSRCERLRRELERTEERERKTAERERHAVRCLWPHLLAVPSGALVAQWV